MIIGCRSCVAPSCNGCNLYELEKALRKGYFDAMKVRGGLHICANVKPVVRGKWVPKSTNGSWRVDTCSVCKKDTTYVKYAPAYDYCPNCGADMRGAGE